MIRGRACPWWRSSNSERLKVQGSAQPNPRGPDSQRFRARCALRDPPQFSCPAVNYGRLPRDAESRVRGKSPNKLAQENLIAIKVDLAPSQDFQGQGSLVVSFVILRICCNSLSVPVTRLFNSFLATFLCEDESLNSCCGPPGCDCLCARQCHIPSGASDRTRHGQGLRAECRRQRPRRRDHSSRGRLQRTTQL